MKNFDEIISVLEQIQTNCEELDSWRVESERRVADLEKLAADYVEDASKQMEQAIEKYVQENFTYLKNQLNKIIDALTPTYKDAMDIAKRKVQKSEFDKYVEFNPVEKLKTAHKYINESIIEINTLISALNNSDLDQQFPHIKTEVVGENICVRTGMESKTYQANTLKKKSLPPSPPLHSLVVDLIYECEIAKTRVDAATSFFKQDFDFKSFKNNINKQARSWLVERKAEVKSEEKEKYSEYFGEKCTNIDSKFFEELRSSAEIYTEKEQRLSNTFSDQIYIGDLKCEISEDPDHLEYFKNSPALKKYISDGNISIPLVWSLKDSQNIFIYTNEEPKYPTEGIKHFVFQIMVQLLRSFPKNRIIMNVIDMGDTFECGNKFQIFDSDDLVSFKPFIERGTKEFSDKMTMLENIANTNRSNINKAIDNNNGIFEYNEHHKGNIQNVHVNFLLNWQEGVEDKKVKDTIESFVQKGPQAGMFNFIVCNDRAEKGQWLQAKRTQDSQDSVEAKEKFFDEIKKNALVFEYDEDYGFLLLDEEERVFAPRNDVNIDDVRSLREELKGATDGVGDIPIKEMFRVTDEASRLGQHVVGDPLSIPIGKVGDEIFDFVVDVKERPHAMIIGGTGSGKTNLFHAIISSVCYKYSPEDVRIYLVDFKKTSFTKYVNKSLPHIDLVGEIEEDLFAGMNVLDNILKELSRRATLFHKAEVSSIKQYNNGERKMPELIVIIDEIPVLLNDDTLGAAACKKLERLVKTAREFGIHIIMAAQTIPTTSNFKRDVLSQMSTRICMKCDVEAAVNAGFKERDVNALMEQAAPGWSLINANRSTKTLMTRIAYFGDTEEKQNAILDSICKKWEGYSSQTDTYVITENIESNPLKTDSIYLAENGNESSYKTHYGLQLGQEFVSGKLFNLDVELKGVDDSNVLIYGKDIDVLRDIMGYSLLSVVKNNYYNTAYQDNPTKIYYINGENSRESEDDLFEMLRVDFPEMVEEVTNADEWKKNLANLYREYKERSNNPKSSYAPYFIFIHALQVCNWICSNEMINVGGKEVNEEKSVPNQDVQVADIMTRFAQRSIRSNDIVGNNDEKEKTLVSVETIVKTLMGAHNLGFKFVISTGKIQKGYGSALGESLKEISNKIIIKGDESMASTLNFNAKVYQSLKSDSVALYQRNDEVIKILLHRFDYYKDAKWYKALRDKLKTEGNK